MLSEYMEGPRSLMFEEHPFNSETSKIRNPYNLKLYFEGTRGAAPGYVITAPTEPVSSAELKNYLKVDTSNTSDDALIAILGKAARRQCENYMRRAIVRQCWYMTMDRVPLESRIVMPRPPMISVTSITTYDTADTGTAMTATSYTVDITCDPGMVFLDFAVTWPTNLRSYNAFRIEYICGLADATAVEDEIKMAIMRLVGMWYEHREEVESGNSFAMPIGVKAILDPFRNLN